MGGGTGGEGGLFTKNDRVLAITDYDYNNKNHHGDCFD